MIIRGGQNIYPVEVENLLVTHPAVLQVAIVPMPDPVMGEKACAFVIPQPGRSMTFDEMVDFLLEKKIAKFKIPERLEIVAGFPMSGDGQKVIKKSLAEDVAGKLKEEGII
jgi:non-ribosomal peptide synthetase component E (peptide arylation enzyme)